MTEFTYEKPDEANFLAVLIAMLKKDSNPRMQEIASILEYGRCEIAVSDGQFSYKRWNGFYTEVYFYVPVEFINSIGNEDEALLLSICVRLMPPNTGLDVMNVFIHPDMTLSSSLPKNPHINSLVSSLSKQSSSSCFVIQPFDKGKFDKRFNDVFSPAIKEAGLHPYRVDEDPRVTIPIEAIEQGIQSAAICLADISTDNPNVWYELGYAFAFQTPVVIVCSNDRTKFPFDIQHRSIVTYDTESMSDFVTLKDRIAEKLRALLER